ncbi:alpha/beta hydrolase family protein [Rhizosphaericola mali]|uniref:Alpha/beta fold hydrolase n=1 Tax=Rhizosphaericola mali TaxID=2545455 RepID=A0A5P2G111_9BACT|nr:alpha/beta hydrolase [Rhizosphaericola mali]QES88358.1 alpha/beta fold hydrolase [Rhizosphaericola mali]
MKKPYIVSCILMTIFSWSILGNIYAQSTDSIRVKFINSHQTIQFGGTLSYPQNTKAKVPAIIIVSGTGPQDRDGNMGGTPMFKLLANLLNKNGYAVLRVDDRGVGETTGKYDSATTKDFAEDALTALHFLQKQKNINPNKIGLLGHSEGGLAIAIAANESKDVKFLISISGIASNGLDALLDQNDAIVDKAPIPITDKKRYNEINKLMFVTAYHNANSTNMAEKLDSTYSFWKTNDDAYVKSLGIEYDHFRFPIYMYVHQATGPWYRYFVRINAEKIISNVKVPVLALNGDKDPMVVPSNLLHWKDYAAEGGNHNVSTHLIHGVNHLYLPESSVKNPSKIQPSAFNTEASDIIAQWLKSLK